MLIREALHHEAQALWELAIRAKSHWGYDEAFLAACSEELYPTDLSMAAIAEVERTPVGFYSLERESSSRVELAHLFIDPPFIQHGLGRALLVHASKRAYAEGFYQLVIQGEPNAEEFYSRCGARKIASRKSESIAGRSLPLFEIDLRESLPTK